MARWLWREIVASGSLPEQRWGQTMVSIGPPKAMIWGGRGGSFAQKYTYYTHIATIDISGTPPKGRIFHSMVTTSDEALIYGGQSGSTVHNDVYSLNLETLTWKHIQTTQPPAARFAHITGLLENNRMLIFGGRNDDAELNDVNILKIDTHEWYPVPYLASGIDVPCGDGIAGALFDGRLYIFGGFHDASLYVFDVATATWSRITQFASGSVPPQPRIGHAMVAVPERGVVAVGFGLTESIPKNDVALYDPRANVWRSVEMADDSQSQAWPVNRAGTSMIQAQIDGEVGVLCFGGETVANRDTGELDLLNSLHFLKIG